MTVKNNIHELCHSSKISSFDHCHCESFRIWACRFCKQRLFLCAKKLSIQLKLCSKQNMFLKTFGKQLIASMHQRRPNRPFRTIVSFLQQMFRKWTFRWLLNHRAVFNSTFHNENLSLSVCTLFVVEKLMFPPRSMIHEKFQFIVFVPEEKVSNSIVHNKLSTTKIFFYCWRHELDKSSNIWNILSRPPKRLTYSKLLKQKSAPIWKAYAYLLYPWEQMAYALS